jgi:excinuclease ABC subunit C
MTEQPHKLQSKLGELPDTPGVYLFKDAQGRVLYVGKAASLKKRVRSYFQGRPLDFKTQKLLERIVDVDWIVTASEHEALLLEDALIKRHQPRYNVRLRDDKRYPYLKLTAEPFPRLVITRRLEGDAKQGARYFGPYTQPGALREARRVIQKIFRVRTCPLAIEEGQPARKRPCLDHDLGLCDAPCVGLITQAHYRKLVDEAALFLSGRVEELIAQLKCEMQDAAERLEFERAARLRDRLQALERLALPTRSPAALAAHSIASSLPMRASRKGCRALEELQQALRLPTPPRRIEGFDVSTLQGREPVASMVVFVDGQPKKALYRRFVIRTAQGPDDVAMLAEAVRRRLENALEGDEKFTPLPDLILLDGGKGQLTAVRAAMRELGLEGVPAIALAKEHEHLFIQGRKKPLVLPRRSEALKLLQRVRDEAHRFALEHHRRRRAKETLRSVLDEVPGIGPARKRLLLERFGSIKALREATPQELAQAGLPKAVAERLYAKLHGE